MNFSKAALLCLAVAGTVTPASAAPQSQTSPLTGLYGCTEKTDATERLACFDAEVARIQTAESRSEIVALDQGRVDAVRREAFGFSIPSLPKFLLGGKGAAAGKAGADAPARLGLAADTDADTDAEERTFAVTRVSRSGARVALYLDNGNVWQLVESEELNAPSKPPFNVRIRTASLGSFILSVEGRNKGYRVRRVQ